MPDNSTTLHEPQDALSPQVLDRHRATASLMEELEATDWYAQRVEACSDPELQAILAHNRDEEQEHACMLIEWMRRHDAEFAGHLDTYLYKEGSIMAHEHAATSGSKEASPAPTSTNSSLNIGSLKNLATEDV